MTFGSSAQARHALDAPIATGLAYRRHGNPTVLQLEQMFAQLQCGALCLAVTSGMTACAMVFSAFLRSGDHVVKPNTLFYETSEVLDHLTMAAGIAVTRVCGGDAAALLGACRATTRMMFVESPANPTLLTVDLPRLVKGCRARGILLVVDNTLLTPLGQNVLELGADISVYSLSKHLAGHGDVIGGMVCTREPAVFNTLATWRACSGQMLDPFAAWLVLRSLRSLHARLRMHSSNALRIARMLRRDHCWLAWRACWTGPHAAVNRVSRDLHTGVLALLFASAEQAAQFVDALRGIPVVPTFGNPETTVYHYAGVLDDLQAELEDDGICGGLVRLSVGIEDPQDLLEDLHQALSQCQAVL